MELKGKKVVFLGDSITEGVGASCEDTRYVNVFGKITGATVVNYGIGGTRFAKQVKQFNEWYDKNDFCGRFDKMDDDADIVVVFGATNDYGHGDAPFGEYSDRTPETFIGATHFLMKGLIEKYPGAEIVFMTPIHRAGENNPDAKGHILKDYVDIIRNVAEYYSIPVLDLFSVYGVCPDIAVHKEKYCPDGLHPNDAGHKRLAEKLKAFLETM